MQIDKHKIRTKSQVDCGGKKQVGCGRILLVLRKFEKLQWLLMESPLALTCVCVCVYLVRVHARTCIYTGDNSFFAVQCCPMCHNTSSILNPHPQNTRSANACDHSIYLCTFSADLDWEPLIKLLTLIVHCVWDTLSAFTHIHLILIKPYGVSTYFIPIL